LKQISYYRLVCNFILIALVTLFTAVETPVLSAAEQSISGQFISKVHAYRNVGLVGKDDWKSLSSPWAPYVSRQYSEGLSPKQLRQYLIFQKEGRCEQLLNLELIGFESLYPELSRALSDNIVKQIFTHEIVPSHSFGAMRCRAYAMLNPIIEREKQHSPIYYYLSIPGTNLSGTPEKIYEYREVILREAFSIIYSLAACEDYKPAIADIIEYSKLHLIFVDRYQKYYFYLRAKHYGLETPGINQLLLKLEAIDTDSRDREIQSYLEMDPHSAYFKQKLRTLLATKSSKRLKIIQHHLQYGDLESAKKIVFWSTDISCSELAPG